MCFANSDERYIPSWYLSSVESRRKNWLGLSELRQWHLGIYAALDEREKKGVGGEREEEQSVTAIRSFLSFSRIYIEILSYAYTVLPSLPLSFSRNLCTTPSYSCCSRFSPNGISYLVSRFSLSIFFPLPRFPPAPRFCVNLHSLLLSRPVLSPFACLSWRSFSPTMLYLPGICVYLMLSLLPFYYHCIVISRNQPYGNVSFKLNT